MRETVATLLLIAASVTLAQVDNPLIVAIGIALVVSSPLIWLTLDTRRGD